MNFKPTPKLKAEHSNPPLPFVPRCLSRTHAAAYLGVSPGLFDRMVKDGTMPKAIRFYGRNVWDRVKIDQKLDALSEEPVEDRWDRIAV